jgi:uncharacterized membrane protein
MMRLRRVSGRFSWFAVDSVAFLSASLVGFDLAWRLISIELKSLLVYATLADLLAAVIIAVICIVLRQRWRNGVRRAAGR